MKRVFGYLQVLFLLAAVAACAGPNAPRNPDVAGLSIAGSAAAAIGGTTQLQAVAVIGDGSPQDVTAQADWISSAPSVATVSTNGLVQGLTAGEAIVSAAYGGRTAQLVVAVSSNPVPGVSVREVVITGDAVLGVGQTAQLEAVARLSDGTSRTVTSDATWTTSAPSIVQVAGGRVTGGAEGMAVITAEYDGHQAEMTMTVSAVAVPVVSLSLIGNVSMGLGQPTQLQAIAQLADGSSRTVTADATWRSSDPAVATVDRGLVNGMTPGSAVITVTYGGQAAEVTVVVSG